MKCLIAAAALAAILNAQSACAEWAFSMAVPDSALVVGLDQLSCRDHLPPDDPDKESPCSREELIRHGKELAVNAAALTAMAECRPGDRKCWELAMTTIYTRRALATSPGAEISVQEIVATRAQYEGWRRGKLSPSRILVDLPAAKAMAAVFIAGGYDGSPLRFTHFYARGVNPSWARAAKEAGIYGICTSDGQCWITGTREAPALIPFPLPQRAKRGVSWNRCRCFAPEMMAALKREDDRKVVAMR